MSNLKQLYYSTSRHIYIPSGSSFNIQCFERLRIRYCFDNSYEMLNDIDNTFCILSLVMTVRIWNYIVGSIFMISRSFIQFYFNPIESTFAYGSQERISETPWHQTLDGRSITNIEASHINNKLLTP